MTHTYGAGAAYAAPFQALDVKGIDYMETPTEDRTTDAYAEFRRLDKRDSPGLQPESTFSRTRLELKCAELASDYRIAALSDAAHSVFWRLMPYAPWGLPGDFVVMARHARCSPRKLRRVWPELEPFFEKAFGDWHLKPNKWSAPFLATRQADRVSLRHLFSRLVDFWGRACVYCWTKADRLAIEHIVPVARGGTDELTNLTLACRSCNSSKGTKTAAEFGHPQVHIKAERVR